MNKVSKFENYLRQNPDLNLFEKLQNGDSTFFRGHYNVNNNDLIFLVDISDSVFTQVLCRILTLNNPAKKEQMLYLINNLNLAYKNMKYTLDDSGNVDLAIEFTSLDEDFNPETLLYVTLNSFKNMENDYAKFMRILWA